MTRIFISYRRTDSQAISDRIYDYLVTAFGKENVFKDVDSIELARDFRAAIERNIINSDVVLVVIGKQWAEVKDNDGNKRLNNPGDFVRIEVEMALRHVQMVIPVTVDSANMPAETVLPTSLHPLLYRNGAILRSDPDFKRDMERLVNAIRQQFPGTSPAPTPVKRPFFPVTLIAGAAATIILIVIVLAVVNNNPGTGNSPTYTPTTETAALISTATSTFSPTESATEIELTVQNEMAQLQAKETQTKEAVQTDQAATVIAKTATSDAELMLTPTQWTAIPTINIQGTVSARTTQTQAAIDRQSSIITTPTFTVQPHKTDSQIEIVEVRTPGELSTEGIVLRNNGSTIDLTGWTLSDSDGNVFTFPQLRLFSNGEITVYTGTGQNTPIVMYWGLDHAVWGVTGNIVTLKDASNHVQTTYPVP